MRCAALIYPTAGGRAFVTCGVFNMTSELIGNVRQHLSEGVGVFPSDDTVLNGYFYGLHALAARGVLIIDLEDIRISRCSVILVGERLSFGVKLIIRALGSGKIHAHIVAGKKLQGHIGKTGGIVKSPGNTVVKFLLAHVLILDFFIIIVVDRRARRLLFTVRVRAACLKHVSRDALVHALYLRTLIFRQRVISGLQGKQIKRTFIGNRLECDLRFLFLVHRGQFFAVFRYAHVKLVIKAFQIIYIRIVLSLQNPMLCIVVKPRKIVRASR